MSEIYLDYNSTTPLLPEARRAMEPFLTTEFANPSSAHRAGQRSRHAIETARENVARAMGAGPQDILFTSGGTEANNLALIGTLRAAAKQGKKHLILSAVEHSSARGPAQFLAREGFSVSEIPVDSEGRARPESLAALLREDTALVSLMHANNETGAIQPVAEIAAIAQKHGARLHVDAVQSFGKIPFDIASVPCDLATVAAHKVGGPKGAGALYVRRGVALEPVLFGGSQEKNIRPGTENVAAIAGFGAAVAESMRRMPGERLRLLALKKSLREGLLKQVGDVTFNGPADESRVLPNTLNAAFAGIEARAAVTNLDLCGIYVSTGSACAAGSTQSSHVLLAMGLSERAAKSCIRFSLGSGSTEADIRVLLRELVPIVARLRKGAAHAG